MFSDWIRRTAFWTLDFFKGSPIRKEYLDIKNKMKKISVDDTKEKIDLLLDHAFNNTYFYGNYKKMKFEELPVINKSIIKDNYDSFVASNFLNEKLHYMSTSGSTGTPFTVPQNIQKRNRVLAELIYFDEVAGQKIGQRFCFFRVWNKKDSASKSTFFIKNEIPVEISNLDDKNLEKIRILLKKDKRINKIMGYASSHKQLVKYLQKKGDTENDFNLKLIISGSEMLETSVRTQLREMFGCSVISRYSNQENGVLAQQCSLSEEYHINAASYFIELLGIEDDKPVKDGEIGRIVVTDLYNYAMPLIRYDTGDLGVKKSKSVCGWDTALLENIQGRRANVCYNTSGEMISPLVLDKIMEPYIKLAQCQFIQEGKNEYRFIINDPEQSYSDEEFLEELKRYFGDDANIRIERVDNIPCCDSRKFMQMVCNYKP